MVALGVILGFIVVGFFIGDLYKRLGDSENENRVLRAAYKELSHHVLVTNRDGFRPSSLGGRWDKVPRKGCNPDGSPAKGTVIIRTETEEVST